MFTLDRVSTTTTTTTSPQPEAQGGQGLCRGRHRALTCEDAPAFEPSWEHRVV